MLKKHLDYCTTQFLFKPLHILLSNTQVIKQILHKLSVIEAKVIAAEAVYLEKLQAILTVTTSRHFFTPRI